MAHRVVVNTELLRNGADFPEMPSTTFLE